MSFLSLRSAAIATLPGNPPMGIHALAKAQYFSDGVIPFPQSLRFLVTRVPSPRYDEIFRKACHNCYEKQYSDSLFTAFTYTKSIEIDFYDQSNYFTGGGEKPQYWYVRHDTGGGNENCCSGSGGLETCLTDIQNWSIANPDHDVITVFLDKKQTWGDDGEQRGPKDLDILIQNCIPVEKLYRPFQLKGSYKSLRQAAQNGAWPNMNELRNKIIFVLTGGELLNHNKTQSQYVKQRGNEAILFVAPDTDDQFDILKNPDQFDEKESDWVVFYNIEIGDELLAPLIRGMGYVSRVWGMTENSKNYSQLINGKVNFIALFNFKETNFNDGQMEGIIV